MEQITIIMIVVLFLLLGCLLLLAGLMQKYTKKRALRLDWAINATLVTAVSAPFTQACLVLLKTRHLNMEIIYAVLIACLYFIEVYAYNKLAYEQKAKRKAEVIRLRQQMDESKKELENLKKCYKKESDAIIRSDVTMDEYMQEIIDSLDWRRKKGITNKKTDFEKTGIQTSERPGQRTEGLENERSDKRQHKSTQTDSESKSDSNTL